MSTSKSTTPTFKGDIAPAVQAKIVEFSEVVMKTGAFARSTGSTLVLKEVEVFRRDKDGKVQARVIYTAPVHDDMLNISGNMHGGCAVYLIDICSSMALAVLGMATDKPWNFVSQAINTVYHAPAPLNAQLEIVNTTLSFGSRTVSATTEIWDVTHNRLCVSAVHNKMKPSDPKPQAKL
ncbi:hypothetical protein BD413DRAFT_469582 [Trametes elegans]|nr:hypothetical protein BD413DRAFT_469582 [Trametes elegans]